MATIKIYCQNCKTLLYKYHKDISGHLIKCYKDKIFKDYTMGDLKCPGCGKTICQSKQCIHGKPANKLFKGKFLSKNEKGLIMQISGIRKTLRNKSSKKV